MVDVVVVEVVVAVKEICFTLKSSFNCGIFESKCNDIVRTSSSVSRSSF